MIISGGGCTVRSSPDIAVMVSGWNTSAMTSPTISARSRANRARSFCAVDCRRLPVWALIC